MLVPLTDKQTSWYKQLLSGLDADMVDTVMAASEEGEGGGSSGGSGSGSGVVATSSSAAGSKRPRKEQEPSSSSSSAAASSSSSSSSGSSSNDADWRKLMNLLLQLRKVCNHVYLMPDAAPDPYVIDQDLVAGSGKLEMLDRMLPRLRADGHRVLLFSQFTSMLDILEDYCEYRDLPFVRLDGNTNRWAAGCRLFFPPFFFAAEFSVVCPRTSHRYRTSACTTKTP